MGHAGGFFQRADRTQDLLLLGIPPQGCTPPNHNYPTPPTPPQTRANCGAQREEQAVPGPEMPDSLQALNYRGPVVSKLLTHKVGWSDICTGFLRLISKRGAGQAWGETVTSPQRPHKRRPRRLRAGPVCARTLGNQVTSPAMGRNFLSEARRSTVKPGLGVWK